MRIMKKGINQVEKDNPLTELGKQMQALTLKIETLMIAQAQVPITTPLFPTYDGCEIMHGPGEWTVDDELAANLDENKYVGRWNNSYNKYNKNFNQGQGFKQNQGMYRSKPMRNKRPRQVERQPNIQEIMLQYMTQNDHRMK